MSAHQLVTLNTLPPLPDDMMNMCTTLAEAERHAEENGQAFIYYYPPNKCYYVAERESHPPLTADL